MGIGVYLAIVLIITACSLWFTKTVLRNEGKSLTSVSVFFALVVGVISGGIVGATGFILVNLFF